MEFSNEELETFARGTEVFMAILDKEGIFKKANIRWKQRFNIPLNDLLGTSIYELIHEIEVGEFEIAMNKVVQEGQVCQEIVNMVDESDLKTFAFQFDLTLSNNEIYFVGFDVTGHALEHHSLVQMSRLTMTGGWHYDSIRDKSHWSEEVYMIHDLPPDTEIDADKALSFFYQSTESS